MKSLFVAAVAVCAVSCFGTGAARAQNGPWCAHYDFGNDETVNCRFASFPQCLAEVRGVGGFCVQNSTYGYSARGRWRGGWGR